MCTKKNICVNLMVFYMLRSVHIILGGIKLLFFSIMIIFYFAMNDIHILPFINDKFRSNNKILQQE